MNRSCNEFVEALVEQAPALRGVRDEAVDYWAPEEPPITTLFAELGTAVTVELAEPDAERESRLLALVEQGMTDGDEALRTAVATGLIEALAVTAETRPAVWRRLRAGMGPASGAHADAWVRD